jgi:hypothetical protein
VTEKKNFSDGTFRAKKRLLEAGLKDAHLVIIVFDVLLIGDERLEHLPLWQRRERLNKLIDQDRLKDPKVLACSPVVTPNPLFCVISFKAPAFLREYGVLLALKHLQSITVLDEAGNCGA